MGKYYTPEEIGMHNSGDDCWVSIFNKVYNLSELIQANRGILAMPIIAAAGTSVSHWFDEKTNDVKTYMDPARNVTLPYTPQGRFIHVPCPDPKDNDPIADVPWWKDNQYIIGQVSTVSTHICLYLSRQIIYSI